VEKEKKNTVKKTASTTAKKQTVKKLNMTSLKAESKKLDIKKTETVLANGTEYTFECDQFFRASKQEALLNDLLSYYEKVTELGTEILAFATPYVALLMIKYFTNIDVPDDFDEAVQLLNDMIDLEVLDAVLEKMPNKEVSKLNETLQSAMELFLDNLEKNEQELARILTENQIENDEVIDTLPQIEQSEDSESEEESDPENPLN